MIKFYSRRNQSEILYLEVPYPRSAGYSRKDILEWVKENNIKVDVLEMQALTPNGTIHGHLIELHFLDQSHEILFKLTWL
jgi:hypothetical protein